MHPHDYRAFTRSKPSPVKLMPATIDSDAVAKLLKDLVTYLSQQLMLKAAFSSMFFALHCHLLLFLMKETSLRLRRCGSRIFNRTVSDAGTFTCHAKHCKNSGQDVNAHGVLIHDKCCTGAPITPDLMPLDSHVTETSSILAMEHDPGFFKQCRKATTLAIHGYPEMEEAKMCMESKEGVTCTTLFTRQNCSWNSFQDAFGGQTAFTKMQNSKPDSISSQIWSQVAFDASD